MSETLSFIKSIISDIGTIIGIFYHFIPVFFFFFSIPLAFIFLSYYIKKCRKNRLFKNVKFVTFIHPGFDDFGGGEKVLWEMIRTFYNISRNDSYTSAQVNQPKGTYDEESAKLNPQKELPKDKIILNILAGKRIIFEDFNKKLHDRFLFDLRRPYIKENKESNLSGKLIQDYNEIKEFILPDKYDFVIELRYTPIFSSYYLKPIGFLTMFFQIIGQIIFAFEVVTKCYSDVYIDTTGLPFTYPIFYLFGHAHVTAYTHYPFISKTMVEQIKMDALGIHPRGYRPRGFFKELLLVKYFKLFYYYIIFYLYRYTGRYLSYAMCNSTWTFEHMEKIWPNLLKRNSLVIIYPPCNIEVYGSNLDICRENTIVSFGQFRPEKQQIIQVYIFSELIKICHLPNLELHIIGGVRNEDDKKIYDQVQQYVYSLGLQNQVKLIPNATMKMVQDEFAMAKIGIHTMVDEHFGISIIEMMAAGLLVVAHKSGGAEFDIIKNNETNVGRLAYDYDQYIIGIRQLLENYDSYKYTMGFNARMKAKEFSEEAFREKIKDALKSILVIEN